MLRFLMDDAEDAGRRLASLLAARYRCPQNPAVGVINGDLLVAQRNDGHDRLASRSRFDGLDRASVPTGCSARVISRRNQCGQTRDDKPRGARAFLLVLRIRETRRHARRIGSGVHQLALRDIHNAVWWTLPTRTSPFLKMLSNLEQAPWAVIEADGLRE